MALTDKDREMAHEAGLVAAQTVIARVMEVAMDPVKAAPFVEVWSGHVQRFVGKAVLRMLLYLLVTLCLFGVFKWGLFERLLQAAGVIKP